MMRIIDLSHTIEPGMPCYPGTPEPIFNPLSAIEKDGYSEQLFTLSSHTGTHVDLPSHILSEGSSLDDLNLDRFTGNGIAIDVSSKAGKLIQKEAFYGFEPLIGTCDFLLLYSGWSRYWGSPDYYCGYPVLAPDAALWLTGVNLKGLGVDMISVDAPDSIDFSIHRRLLQSGILLIENLSDLFPLLNSPFNFFCFPLKIVHAEAAPVRAVAMVSDERKA